MNPIRPAHVDPPLASGLLERDDFFQGMADLMPLLMWCSDPDGQVSFVNHAWLEFTGKQQTDPINSSWFERMHPEDVQQWVRVFDPAHARQEPFTVEIRVQGHDDQYRWMSCTGQPLQKGGGFLGFMGTCVDINDQRLNEEALERRVSERTHALQQANTVLQRRNYELEQFAYVTSHDLQEPLRKIRVFVDMLYRQEMPIDLASDRIEALSRIRSSADRMSQLIKDLLSYSRLGQEGNPFVPTDLNTIVLATLGDFDLRIEETGARVHVNSLPIIEAIPLQMNQLFHNLLGNALKFQKPGTAPVLRIFSKVLGDGEIAQYPSLEQDRAYFRIVVKDNGIGFNQDFVDKIFVIFQRLNPKETFPGTGIGLAICRKIVQHHGGEIFAYGIENEGAEFHILLPSHQA